MSRYRISLPSSSEACGRLRSYVRHIGRKEGFSDQFSCRIELAVHEAFINAASHGNRGMKELPVSISFSSGLSSQGAFLDVEIIDSGNGFNLPDTAESAEVDNLTCFSGRGVHIIRNFAESVRQESDSGEHRLALRFIPY
jgi:anti-sigma regulatory factor (Ser/Thr protein kinase)